MDLSSFSDQTIRDNLLKLTGNEREVTLQILYYLIEVEKRGLFREEGYSSLYDYCRRKLFYSESGAYRRVTGARSLKANPELGKLFLEGQVSVCCMAAAFKSVKENLTTVSEIVGKSKREVETLIAFSKPVASKPKEVIKPLAIKASSTPLVPSIVKEERYELKFSVSKEVYEHFTQTKAQLSNKLGKDLSLEATFGKLLELYLKPKTKKSTSNPNSRYVPLAVKQTVRNESQGQCCFVSKDGVQCTERHYLQFDHVQPYALGGKTEASNLRLLCPAHNQLMAEKCFNA